MSLAATLTIGAAALVVGWIGVSGEPATSRQTAWMDVGIGGLVIAGIGTAVWLMTARRAIGQRRRELLPDIAAAAPRALVDITPAEEPPLERLVVLPGMTRYHRSSCELVAGKPVKPLNGRRRKATSLAPCGVCQPESTGIGQ
jgi:hypothetical protein